MEDKRKRLLIRCAVLGGSLVLFIGLWFRPTRQNFSAPTVSVNQRQSLMLPRAEELGIVLPQGASAPAPDPPVYITKTDRAHFPPRSERSQKQERLLEQKKQRLSITPTPEELEELERKGAVIY